MQSNEAIECFRKIEVMKLLTLHRFTASSLSTLSELMPKSPCNSIRISDTYERAKATIICGLAMEI
jgi:hypothetical protein